MRLHIAVRSDQLVADRALDPRKVMNAVRRQLGEWLLVMGFSYVVVEYAGENWRATILEPRLFRTARADYFKVHGVRGAQLIELFEYLLDMRHPDWRDANGSCGDFRWSVSTGELIHTHYVRGTRKDHLTHQGWF